MNTTNKTSTKSLRQDSEASETPPPLPTSPLPTSPRLPPPSSNPLPKLNGRQSQSRNGHISQGLPSVPGTAV